MTTRGLLGRGVLAGLAGGLAASLVALVLAWPALDAAVALETAAAQAHSAAGIVVPEHEVAVSRQVQRAGGVVGLVLVAVVLGGALALALRRTLAAGPRAGGPPVFRRSLQWGLSVLVALVVVPQLRYPALPPGSAGGGGDHLGAVVLGVGVVAAYVLARGTADERGLLTPVAEVALAAAAVLLALGGAALLPDRVGGSGLPGDLLWDFRVGALAVQVVLVTVTAALLGVFLDLALRRADRRGRAEVVRRGPAAAPGADPPVAAAPPAAPRPPAAPAAPVPPAADPPA